jgi:hypothetical protein
MTVEQGMKRPVCGADSEVGVLRGWVLEEDPLIPHRALDLREGEDEDEEVGWVEEEGLEVRI